MSCLSELTTSKLYNFENLCWQAKQNTPHQDSSLDAQVLCRNYLSPFPPAGESVFLPIWSALTSNNFSSVKGFCEYTCYMEFARIQNCTSLEIILMGILCENFCVKKGRSYL